MPLNTQILGKPTHISTIASTFIQNATYVQMTTTGKPRVVTYLIVSYIHNTMLTHIKQTFYPSSQYKGDNLTIIQNLCRHQLLWCAEALVHIPIHFRKLIHRSSNVIICKKSKGASSKKQIISELKTLIPKQMGIGGWDIKTDANKIFLNQLCI